MSSSRTSSTPDRALTAALALLLAGGVLGAPGDLEVPLDGRWHAYLLPGVAGSAVEFRGVDSDAPELQVRVRGAGGVARDVKVLGYTAGQPRRAPELVLGGGQGTLRMIHRARGRFAQVRFLEQWFPPTGPARDIDGLASYRGRWFSVLAGLPALRQQMARARDTPLEGASGPGELGKNLRSVAVFREFLADVDPLPPGFELGPDGLRWGGGRVELRQWIEVADGGFLDPHGGYGYLFLDREHSLLELWTTGMQPEWGLPLAEIRVRGDRVFLDDFLLTGDGMRSVHFPVGD